MRRLPDWFGISARSCWADEVLVGLQKLELPSLDFGSAMRMSAAALAPVDKRQLGYAARVVSGPTLLTGICFCADCGGSMTLRTGKGGRYRYYTCSIKARQGEAGCKGRSIPMERLDNLVTEHIAERLLQPERLEELLTSVLDRRQERAERRREHIQAQADAARVSAMLGSSGQQAITPQMVQKFARTARERIRIDGGGYRRDLRALAQCVEVADHGGPLHRLEKQSASDADRCVRRKIGYARRSQFCSELAEGVGFEPTRPFRA
jgi:Recombinase zinc beta ribbon domain